MTYGKCNGQCTECCTVSFCSNRERHLINKFIKHNNLDIPYIGEMSMGWGYVLPNTKDAIRFSKETPDVKCSYLVENKCAIYEVRPAICRMHGACKQMPCSYFPEEAKGDMPFEKLVDLGFLTREQYMQHQMYWANIFEEIRIKNLLKQ